MKKLLILTLICFALVGIGNVFSRNISTAPSNSPSDSSWAMFKDLFH